LSDATDSKDEEKCANGIKTLLLVAHLVFLHSKAPDPKHCEADRQVDEEDPAPPLNPQNLGRAGEQSTNERPDHTRDAKDGKKETLIFGALSGREHVAHDGQRQSHEATRT
jgi:hypothetical protein